MQSFLLCFTSFVTEINPFNKPEDRALCMCHTDRQTDRQGGRACSDLCDNVKVLYEIIIEMKQCL